MIRGYIIDVSQSTFDDILTSLKVAGCAAQFHDAAGNLLRLGLVCLRGTRICAICQQHICINEGIAIVQENGAIAEFHKGCKQELDKQVQA